MKRIMVLLLLLPTITHGQIIITIAGDSIQGYSGDGGQATNAELFLPSSVFADTSNNIYITIDNFNAVRKIDTNGIITTIAGTGTPGYSGDGGSATAAQLNEPTKAVVDASGNIYISDAYNNRVRKIDISGTITTIAGNGFAGFSGDGGAASAAELNIPNDIALDVYGNIYICDAFDNRVRKVDTSHIITTIAGNGIAGFSGDGGLAISAELNGPFGVAVDHYGNVYIADDYNNRIRKIDTFGIISTIAGNGMMGYNGDGIAATAASLYLPPKVTADDSGNIYIGDGGNNRVRKVDTSQIITTIAGNGIPGFSGDGGVATAAELNVPGGVAIDHSGNLLICDINNNRIREIFKSTDLYIFPLNISGINVFPNPTSSKLTISLPINITNITISNLLGQTLFTQNYNSEQVQIDVSTLPTGIYLIKINATEVRKFVKQ